MTKFDSVIDLVRKQQPLQQKQIDKSLKILTPTEIDAAERTLSFFTERLNYTLVDIADAYLWFIDSFMEAQFHFAQTGTYQHSTFAEIENYYKDKQLMKNYVVSLATTLYLFPQHILVNRFYQNQLIKLASKRVNDNPLYLEIGPGHGHLFVMAMENTNFSHYTAVDIAQSSVDTTQSYANFCLPDKTNYEVMHKDFFEFNNSEKFGSIVMGEVLEHVEQPKKFLHKIHEIASDNAFIYITTAVNAPIFDHIYYFSTVKEVEQMFTECGFDIVDKYYGIANNVSMEKAEKFKYSIVPAYVLAKM